MLAIPFAMLGEIYPQKGRGLAAGLTIASLNLMNFFNVQTFSISFEFFGPSAMFGFYAFVALLGILFSHFYLVETKGKSLQEIEEYFEGEKRDEKGKV